MVRKKILQGQGKFRDLTRLIRTDLIILKAGRSIWGHGDLNDIFRK